MTLWSISKSGMACRKMRIIPETNPLLIFDEDAGKYYFVFYNTKTLV